MQPARSVAPSRWQTPRPRGSGAGATGQGLRTGRDRVPGQRADGPRVWERVTEVGKVCGQPRSLTVSSGASSGFDAGRPRLRTWPGHGAGVCLVPAAASGFSSVKWGEHRLAQARRERGPCRHQQGGPGGLQPTGRGQTACWGSGASHSAVRQAVLAPVQLGGSEALALPLGLAERGRVLLCPG